MRAGLQARPYAHNNVNNLSPIVIIGLCVCLFLVVVLRMCLFGTWWWVGFKGEIQAEVLLTQ